MHKEQFNAKLTNKFRLSNYGLYNKRCSDASDFSRYCVCDPDENKSSTVTNSFKGLLDKRTSPNSVISFPNVSVKETVKVLINNTLALLIREYKTNEDILIRRQRRRYNTQIS